MWAQMHACIEHVAQVRHNSHRNGSGAFRCCRVRGMWFPREWTVIASQSGVATALVSASSIMTLSNLPSVRMQAIPTTQLAGR